MKKGLIGALAVALAVVVITVAVVLTLNLDYEKSKPAANPSKTQNSELASSQEQSSQSASSGSQSKPSIEMQLGVYADFLVQDYFNQRYTTYICIKDIDGNGINELLVKDIYRTEVFTYKNGVLRLGVLDLTSGTIGLYNCEGFPGVVKVSVVDGMELFEYITLKDNAIYSEEVWKNNSSHIDGYPDVIEISKDKKLIQATKDAYENNTALNFEVLSSFSEIQQATANHWYYKITRTTNCWSQKVVYGGQAFYYIADDGLYRYSFNGHDAKFTDGKIGGLMYDGKLLYYSTKTAIKCYDAGFYKTTTVFDLKSVSGIDVSEGILDFKLHGEYLYIKNTDTSAFRFNLNTKKAEMFLDDFSTAVFGDDYCYYIDHADETFSVYSIDYETLETKLVAGEGVTNPKETIISSVYMANNDLYYYDRVTEWTYRSGGSELIRGNPEVVQGHDGEWVYSALVENGKVKILKSTTGAVFSVVKLDATDIVDGHYIVTERATFTIPNDPNQKISMVWY